MNDLPPNKEAQTRTELGQIYEYVYGLEFARLPQATKDRVIAARTDCDAQKDERVTIFAKSVAFKAESIQDGDEKERAAILKKINIALDKTPKAK